MPKAIPSPSIVANPSGSPIPDADGQPGGLRAHLPGVQRGKAKPGQLVSPQGEQERHGHLRGPKTGTETPPPTRAPASRTILSPHACVPPPPTEQGRPHRGGDKRPARCASAGRAKNNCGVLATAFPLAGLPWLRLRIGALPRPVSRRGCARRALPGDVVTGAAAACPRPGCSPRTAGPSRARGHRLPWGRTTTVTAIPGAAGRWRHLHCHRLSCTTPWQAEGTLSQHINRPAPFISKQTHC